MRRDKQMLYVNGNHFVRQSVADNRFYTCDVEGIAKGEDLEHVGDDYATLDEAKLMVDFWASGGHWKDRPDR
jgi:hypothetical protein